MENDLKFRLEQLHQRVDQLKVQINTEEATKNAFVMPFIQIPGYDIYKFKSELLATIANYK